MIQPYTARWKADSCTPKKPSTKIKIRRANGDISLPHLNPHFNLLARFTVTFTLNSIFTLKIEFRLNILQMRKFPSLPSDLFFNLVHFGILKNWYVPLMRTLTTKKFPLSGKPEWHRIPTKYKTRQKFNKTFDDRLTQFEPRTVQKRKINL